MILGRPGHLGLKQNVMKRHRSPLRWKVTLSVSLLLVLVSGAVALALIRYERDFLKQEGEKRVLALAENLALNARDPLLAVDELRLASLAHSVMRDVDARYAYISDHDGRVLYHPNVELIGQILPIQGFSPAPDVLEAQVAIRAEDTQIGTAVVGLDAAFITRALKATALGLLVPLCLGTLAGVLGIFLLTGVQVRRLETLERAVQALAKGNTLARAEVGGQDEIARLAAHFNVMVSRLHVTQGKVERGFTETVSSLAAAIEANDSYTRGHCERVARISTAIGARLEMPSEDLKDLELAAILHDIGKIGVPAEVLAKKGPLDDSELKAMQQHPEIGATILSPISFLNQVSKYVRHHHEDLDGSGYPDGLQGDEIPLPSKVIHLADAYDAITSTRPYREALSHEEALSRIQQAEGRQFDPQIVTVFMELVAQGVIDAILSETSEVEAA